MIPIRKRKTNKTKWWFNIFLVITFFQLTTLFIVDRFLAPPQISAMTTNQGEGATDGEQIEPPARAIEYAITSDGQTIAYTTENDELVIADKDGTLYQEQVGKVTHMKWLGKSNTLFYVVKGNNLNGYLLPTHEMKPVFLKKWTGDQREIENTFFSPFLEILYVQIKNGERTELYRYLASQGMSKLPLPNLEFTDIQYDDKSDVFHMTDSKGETWKYENQRLYKPDGTVVRDFSSENEIQNNRMLQGAK